MYVYEKPAETARMVKGNDKEASLFLAEHDGAVWATNRFWMVPAERVTGLLSVHNLEVKPGAFDVNGHVTRRGDDAPKIAGILDAVLDGAELLARHEIAGNPTFVQPPAGRKPRLLALFTRSDGYTAVDATWLEWITGRLPERYGVRFVGNVRAFQREGHKAVAFVVSRQRIKPGTGQYVGDGSERRYVAEAWEDHGEELLGVLMPVRLAS